MVDQPPAADARPRRAPLDYESLAEYLAALAYPLRLELLDVLERPHTLTEIRVRPHKVESGGNPDRPAAKQTVLAHLDRLVEAGLVATGEVESAGKTLTTYTVNPQRLYALVEDLRRLSVKHTGRGRGVDVTGTLEGAARPASAIGPRLVLVHGVYEGRAYPLDEALARDGAWLVGRRRGLAVSLDYDPFVSVEHAAITRRADRFVVTDLPEAKNGTALNWEYLPRGGSAELKQGDIVGVGRSLLVFYET